MSKEYIEKEAAIRNVCKGCDLCDTDNCICTDKARCYEYDAILDTPSADAKPIVYAHWICETKSVRMGYNDYEDWNKWLCSNCGYVRNEGWKYNYEGKEPEVHFCENCGAKIIKDMENN